MLAKWESLIQPGRIQATQEFIIPEYINGLDQCDK